jgi:hypothetical protein
MLQLLQLVFAENNLHIFAFEISKEYPYTKALLLKTHLIETVSEQ